MEIRPETFILEDGTKIEVYPKPFSDGVHGPDMVLSIPELIEGQFPHLENSVRVHYFKHGIKAYVNSRGEGNLTISGALKNQDAIVVIPNDIFIPVLLTEMFNRALIPKIAVKYLNEKGMRAQYVFGQCLLEEYQVGQTMSLFGFRSQEVTLKVHAVDSETGDASGVTQAQYDFAKMSGVVSAAEADEQTEPEAAEAG